MSHTRITLKGWPEELAYMLSQYPAVMMPDLYFEYLLLKDAMYYGDYTWAETDPFQYGLIKRMEFQDYVFSLYPFIRND